MPLAHVAIENVGTIGLVADTAPHTLPPEAWTDGINIRFLDNKVVRSRGKRQVLGTPSIAPYWALGVPFGTGYIILYAGVEKIYAVVASTEVHTNITRQTAAVDVDYGMIEELLWNGGMLGGIPILNNGIDVPQFWATPNVGTKMADLTNWPSTHRARIVRPFKEFLIALYLTESGTQFPHKVLWSHPADPGAVPISWDITDPTKDCGEFELSDAHAGVILDGMPLGNQFIIYKENSAHRMLHVGGQFIFDIKPIPGASGLLHTQCVNIVPSQGKNPFGGMHFCATSDDLVLFDGTQQRSLLSEKLRRYMNDSIDDENFNRSFVTANRFGHEMWFCYPEKGATWPTRRIVWNYDDNSISMGSIADTSFIAQALVGEPTGESDLWDDDTGVWDADITTWDSITPFSSRKLSMLGCSPVNTKLFLHNETDQNDGVNFNSFIERTGLAIVGRDRQGNPKVDFGVRKMLNRVWPKATGAPFFVRVGMQETLETNVVWQTPKLFTPGVDQYVDCSDANGNLPNGRLVAIRFESSDNSNWQLHGYDLDMTLLGMF